MYRHTLVALDFQTCRTIGKSRSELNCGPRGGSASLKVKVQPELKRMIHFCVRSFNLLSSYLLCMARAGAYSRECKGILYTPGRLPVHHRTHILILITRGNLGSSIDPNACFELGNQITNRKTHTVQQGPDPETLLWRNCYFQSPLSCCRLYIIVHTLRFLTLTSVYQLTLFHVQSCSGHL